jgi:hypothetical protein
MWEDLRVSAMMTAVNSSQSTDQPRFCQIAHNRDRGPSWSGIMGYVFDHGGEKRGLYQSAHFAAQLPHSYKEGSPIQPHVHISCIPGDEAAPGQKLLLEFEYTWLNLGEGAAEGSKIITMNYTITEKDLHQEHRLVSFGMIEKPDATISSMLSCRFSRITWSPRWETKQWEAAGVENDSFLGGMLFLEFDFHFQKDGEGSREIYGK